MNTGAFGEGFPYSNFHDLNMDWIIKIAKDFLDQYTNIQEIISTGEQSILDKTEAGLTALDDKAENLEALLQDWYDTHSNDIATQLASAIAEMASELNTIKSNFASYASQVGQEVIATIPEDYTALANKVNSNSTDIKNLEQAILFENGSGTATQIGGYGHNQIVLTHHMIVGHRYLIALKFNNYTTDQQEDLISIWTATGSSGTDRVDDIIGNFDTSFFGTWSKTIYTAEDAITRICPQYNSGYTPSEYNNVDYTIMDLEEYKFLSTDYESVIDKIYNEIYPLYNEGSKTQDGGYSINNFPMTNKLLANHTYNIGIKFNGTFCQYLSGIWASTSQRGADRIDDLVSNFPTPIQANIWYRFNYTPSVDISYICPQYTSSYSASDANIIYYEIIDPTAESAINKLEKETYYKFTPLNTWTANDLLPSINNKLNNLNNDVLLVCQGDSLTGFIEYSGSQEEPEHCPPGMQYKSWTYWLWENMARIKPMCDRLDSKRNGVDFFTTSGTWEQVAGNKFDAEGYTHNFQRERSIASLTYQSNSDGASVTFILDTDTYDKCNIVYSLKPDGADCVIKIAEGDGKLLVSADRTTWVEANNFRHTQQSNPTNLSYAEIQAEGLAIQQRHRRLWLKKATGVTGNVTVSYKKYNEQTLQDAYIYCWGIERWSGNTVFVDNLGRGGRYTRYLSWNISDIFDRNPDFAMYQMPLANETDEGYSNIQGFYEQYFLGDQNNSYKVRSNNYTNVPLIVFLPSGRGTFFDDNNNAIFDSAHQVAGDPVAYAIYMNIYGWLKTALAQYTEVKVLNLYCRLLNEAQGIGKPINQVFGIFNTYPFSLTQDTTHLDYMGSKMYCKYLLPLFQ